jgi:hypothetical protein
MLNSQTENCLNWRTNTPLSKKKKSRKLYQQSLFHCYGSSANVPIHNNNTSLTTCLCGIYTYTYILWFNNLYGCRTDQSGRAVWSMKCLRQFKHWDCVFESQSRHGCLRLFCVCVVLRVGSGLAKGLIPHPRSQTSCLRLRNWSERKRFTDALCSRWEQQE